MELNEYQQKWIDTLQSGKTQKHRGTLKNSMQEAYCCLGIGVCICEPKTKIKSTESALELRPKTLEKLRLKSVGGQVQLNKVSKKWMNKILKRFKMQNLRFLELTELNDGIDNEEQTSFSHQEIGKFIEENPEAVFIEN